MAAKLKVYRTAIGFHDAYVAASSQKAALAAWGTDKPLFARGAAEAVTNPELTAAPLAEPGVVIKRPRGTTEQHIAALPDDPPPHAKGIANAAKPSKSRRSVAPNPKPKPSRSKLDDADLAISEAEAVQAAEIDAIEQEERALQDRRRALEKRHRRTMDQLCAGRDKAAEDYQSAMQLWRG